MTNDERIKKVVNVVLLESLDVLKEAVLTLNEASKEYIDGYNKALKHFDKVVDLLNKFKEEGMEI